MQSSISVIIPIKNNLQGLKHCLLSLRQSNFKNVEIIVVDDCSDVDIKTTANKFDCKYLRNDFCLGPLKSRLKGLKIADNQIAAFIDSDCFAPVNWLENIVLFLKKDIIGIGGVYEYEKNSTLFSKFLSLFSIYWFSQWKKGKTDFLLGGNCAYWKDKLVEFSSFQGMDLLKTLSSGDDTLFNLEIAKKYELRFIPELKVRHAFFPLGRYLLRQINWAFSRMLISFLNPRKKLFKTKDFQAEELFLQLLFTVGLIVSACLSDIVLFNCFAVLFLLSHIRPLIYFLKNEKNALFLSYAMTVLFLRNIMYLLGILKAAAVIINEIFSKLKEVFIIGFNIINPFAPSKLHFFITKDCNAACRYCFNNDHDNFNSPDLDIDQMGSISKKIGIMPYLIITGGEPFLRDDIGQVCKLFYENSLTRFFVLTSNGFFSAKIIESIKYILYSCPRARITVQISLDSLGANNDRIKKLDGLYVNAVNTLNLIKSIKHDNPRLLVNVSTVIIKENTEQIEDIVEYIRKEDLADFHFISPLRGVGKKASLSHIEPERYFRILRGLNQGKARMKNGFFRFFYNKFYNKALSSMRKILVNECTKNKCSVWKQIVVIDNAANVLFCELQPESMGNLLEVESISTLRKSEKFKQKAKSITESNCYCNWGCAIVANIVFNPRTVIEALFEKNFNFTKTKDKEYI